VADSPDTLAPEAVEAEIAGGPWRLEDGALVRDVERSDFAAAIALVDRVAEVAERLNHHPDLAVHDYNVVTLRTMSHDVGGITQRDLRLIREIDALA
jgi:4a-hydroxytetrahydrobiopterin dehydratase